MGLLNRIGSAWWRRANRSWTDRPLRAKGMVVVTIPLVALCFGTLAFVLQDRREQRAAEQVRHSNLVINEIVFIEAALLIKESSTSSFLLLGPSAPSADPYADQDLLTPTLDDLTRLVADNPTQSANLALLKQSIDQRLASLTAMRDAGIEAGDFPATIPANLLQSANDARNLVRQHLIGMLTEEQRLLEERTASEDKARSRTLVTVLAALVVGLVGGLLATMLLMSGVVGRVHRIARNADLLSAGEPLDPSPPGNDEIGRLGAQLEAASALLRDREAALAREGDLLAALMDNIPYPVFFKDRQSRMMRVNMAGARLVGFEDPAQFIGKTDFDFFPAPEAQLLFDSEQQLMATRVPIVNRLERQSFVGQALRWGLDNKAPIFDRDGQVIGLVGSSVDITEMKQAEEARAHLAAIVESSNDAIIGAELDGTITSWNPGAERLYDYSEAEALGHSLAMLVPPSRDDEARAMLEQIGAGVSADAYETVHTTKHGRVFDVALTLSPVRDAEGGATGAAVIARDVSARKHAETALHAANRELEAFTYSVSHDLRAPLRAMHGFSRILAEDYAADMPEEARGYLKLVQDNAKQMGLLVDDLLAFSRLGRQPVLTRPVSLTEIVKQVLNDLAPDRADRQVEVELGELPVCDVDPSLMRQVFANLLGNALKFTRGREVARIEIGVSPDGAAPDEHVIFIKDNGVGFDMTYAHKLFGVFQRLHRAEEYEGTGVGLALVQRIVHRHGGRIWAMAEVDRGATFFIALPAAIPADVAAPAETLSSVA